MTATARELETQFFLTLNSFVEPWVRAGVGSPGIIPTGLVVLETTGRRSGSPRKTPLAATLIEGHLLLSTIRGDRSQWIRNAIANPDVRFWLHGRERRGRAMVHSAESSIDPACLPPLLGHLVDGPIAGAVGHGWAFAIIEPDPR